MRFKCEEGHSIEIEFPDKYYEKGPLIIPCPKCNLRYEITMIQGKANIKPYRHSDPLRFIAMHY